MRYCIQLIAMGYVQPASQQKRWVVNVACNSACGFLDVPTYVLLVHENESRLDSGTEFFGKAQELMNVVAWAKLEKNTWLSIMQGKVVENCVNRASHLQPWAGAIFWYQVTWQLGRVWSGRPQPDTCPNPLSGSSQTHNPTHGSKFRPMPEPIR